MLQQFAAGDTLKFLVTLSAYPASSGWTLNYRLVPRSAGGAAFTFAASASGTQHLVSVPAAATANWPAGDYACGAWVSNAGGERYSIPSESGLIVIKPDPAALPVGTDTRSAAELALAAIDAKLAGKATDGVNRYKINNREVWTYSVPELRQLRQMLQTQVDGERKAAGLMGRNGGARRYKVSIK